MKTEIPLLGNCTEMKLGLSTKRGVDYGERASTLTYLRQNIGTTAMIGTCQCSARDGAVNARRMQGGANIS